MFLGWMTHIFCADLCGVEYDVGHVGSVLCIYDDLKICVFHGVFHARLARLKTHDPHDPHDPHPLLARVFSPPKIVKKRLPSKSHFKARTAHLASFGYPTTLKVIFTICPLFVPNNNIIVCG